MGQDLPPIGGYEPVQYKVCILSSWLTASPLMVVFATLQATTLFGTSFWAQLMYWFQSATYQLAASDQRTTSSP